MASHLRTGESFPPVRLDPIAGEEVHVPNPGRLVHLQLRRFAGCPICNLHIASMLRRREEIAAAGVVEILVFHSRAAELREYEPELPFAVIADPDRHLYRELGVETSPRALLHPRAWMAMLLGPVRGLIAFATRRGPPPALHAHGGRLGLPADFLVAEDGRILAVKYGTHAYDQWSVDELLELASAAH